MKRSKLFFHCLSSIGVFEGLGNIFWDGGLGGSSGGVDILGSGLKTLFVERVIIPAGGATGLTGEVLGEGLWDDIGLAWD